MKKPWFFPALLLCAVLLAGNASAAGGSFGGGNGSAVTPWLIEDCADLQAMNGGLEDAYVLSGPINCGVLPFNVGLGFDPIGDAIVPFTGSFDGKGFEITGLKINRPGEGFVGLFGKTQEADIRRVQLIDVSIQGKADVGALIGSSIRSKITCVSSTGSVNGRSSVGGLVGGMTGSIIKQSSSAANAVAAVNGVGGLVGKGVDDDTGPVLVVSEIFDSFATGSAVGSNMVGGFAGAYKESMVGNSHITNSYSTGLVTTSGLFAGGFVGLIFDDGYCSANFWNTETSGQIASDCGTGKTTIDMKKKSTFASALWDETKWNIADGSYPSLKMTEAVCSASAYETCNSLGLAAYWKLDSSGTGTTAHDYSGNGKDGSLLPAASGPTLVAGKLGNALSFDNLNDYVQLPASNSIIATPNSWTVSAWFKADTINSGNCGDRIITFKANSASDTSLSLCVGDSGNATLLYRDSGGSNRPVNVGPVSAGTWYLLTATYDGVGFRLYINDQLKNTTFDSFFGFGTAAANLGAFNPPSSPLLFDGIIDEVAVWNRKLSLREISDLHNAGTGKHICDSACNGVKVEVGELCDGSAGCGSDCVSGCVEEIDAVLVLDTSGSMINNNKDEWTKSATIDFIDFSMRDPGNKAGLFTFGWLVNNISSLTDNAVSLKTAVISDVLAFYPNGTNTSAGIRAAIDEISANGRPGAKKVIIVLSDGGVSHYTDVAGTGTAACEAMTPITNYCVRQCVAIPIADNTCTLDARAAAQEAKDAGIIVANIGLQIDTSTESGEFVTDLLTDMSSDPSYYLPAPDSENLEELFLNLASGICTMEETTNKPPVANAGPGQSTPSSVPINVNGTCSDSDGTISNCNWVLPGACSFISIPPQTKTGLGANSAFSSAQVSCAGAVDSVFSLSLVADDDKGAVSIDSLLITIVGTGNALPVANAGPNQSAPTGSTVSLPGSCSDSDGTISNCEWGDAPAGCSYSGVQVKSGLNTRNASSALDVICNGLPGETFTFSLVATDDDGGIGSDGMVLTIASISNIWPIADAGPDLSALTGDAVPLIGTCSDSDGTISACEWSTVTACSLVPSPPVTGTPIVSSSASATCSGTPGTSFAFTLTAKDAKDGIHSDEMLVVIRDSACVLGVCDAWETCGYVSDGCGGNLRCGTCILPQTCGGGGVPNSCGCTSTTCAVLGVDCGLVSDGCGGTLDCGPCGVPFLRLIQFAAKPLFFGETSADNKFSSVVVRVKNSGPVGIVASVKLEVLDSVTSEPVPAGSPISPVIVSCGIIAPNLECAPAGLSGIDISSLGQGSYKLRASVVDASGAVHDQASLFFIVGQQIPVPELDLMLLPLVAISALALMFFAGKSKKA